MQLNTSNISASANADESKNILESLINRAFAKAKAWAGVVVALECVLFVGGIVAVFNPNVSLSYPWIAFPLAALGIWIAGQSATARDEAECMKRQYEYLMGFGIAPNKDQLADLLINLPKELPDQTEALLRQGLHYWSKKPLGPFRALENLIESAWYTKHLARFWGRLLVAVFMIAIVLAISLLLLCATSLAGTSSAEAAAKCIAGTLLFLISVGLLRLCFAYYSLVRSASDIDQQANNLASLGNLDIFEVQRLLSEYQLIRASAPLIPTWAWKVRRNSLNAAWAKLKHPKD